MRAERLFRVLGLVDPDLVEEAEAVRRNPWKRWAAMAACLVLVMGLGWLAAGGFPGYGSGMSGGSSHPSGNDSASPGASSGSSADAGVDAGIAFQTYAGPALPLTTAEDPAGLTAERTVTWDLAPGTNRYGETRQWGAAVTDAYILRNSTAEDITVTALYPLAGSFDSLSEIHPAVTVDGSEVRAALYAGPYSGGFQSAIGSEEPDTLNLDSPNSWRDYKALLESGDYLEQALGDYPVLDMPVTLYAFSDYAAPHDAYPAATQAVSFTIDPEKTTVLTYGFNGLDSDGNFRRYSYFVPDGIRREPEQKLLVVLGEDIGPYTLQGYQNGGCGQGEEIDGVSCAVTRRKTTLAEALDLACRACLEWSGTDCVSEAGPVTFEMYRGAAAELLSQYGPISDTPMDRYSDGRLDDLLPETLYQDRVLYLSFPVTVPAGGSAEVSCAFWQAPSYSHPCSGAENADLQGFDLMTRLGSSLEFTRQSAALVNMENAELTEENFGFLWEEGRAFAELDLEQEHYYLIIRPKES